MSARPANPRLTGSRFAALVAAIVAIVWGTAGSAQFAIDGGSILLFPHIEAGDDWDTFVSVVNTSVSPTYAECHYVGEGDVAARGGFRLRLVAGQPTHWIASRGRDLDPSDDVCRFLPEPTTNRCDGSGFDPGVIPALAPGFRGYLICIQMDRSGAPESGNSLAGTATLRRSQSAYVAKYEAVSILGNEANDADRTLCLGGEINETCPRGAEYESCPRASLLTFLVGGGSGMVVPEGTTVEPAITVAPCGGDLSNPSSQHVLQLAMYNEFGQSFSASTAVVGWRHAKLSDVNVVLTPTILGTEIGALRVQSASASPPVVVLGLLERGDDNGARHAASFIRAHTRSDSASTISLVEPAGVAR